MAGICRRPALPQSIPIRPVDSCAAWTPWPPHIDISPSMRCTATLRHGRGSARSSFKSRVKPGLPFLEPVHLLVVYEHGTRRCGESFVEEFASIDAAHFRAKVHYGPNRARISRMAGAAHAQTSSFTAAFRWQPGLPQMASIAALLPRPEPTHPTVHMGVGRRVEPLRSSDSRAQIFRGTWRSARGDQPGGDADSAPHQDPRASAAVSQAVRGRIKPRLVRFYSNDCPALRKSAN
jgi:hypothetical protein